MILNFRCADTQMLFETGGSRRWSNVLSVATRKLAMLNAAVELRDLRSPPGNRLEALQGDRAGQHSTGSTINGESALSGRIQGLAK